MDENVVAVGAVPQSDAHHGSKASGTGGVEDVGARKQRRGTRVDSALDTAHVVGQSAAVGGVCFAAVVVFRVGARVGKLWGGEVGEL